MTQYAREATRLIDGIYTVCVNSQDVKKAVEAEIQAAIAASTRELTGQLAEKDGEIERLKDSIGDVRFMGMDAKDVVAMLADELRLTSAHSIDLEQGPCPGCSRPSVGACWCLGCERNNLAVKVATLTSHLSACRAAMIEIRDKHSDPEADSSSHRIASETLAALPPVPEKP